MKLLPVLLLSGYLLVAGVHGATLTSDGVLGNSGEQGSTLIRFNGEPATGLGIAYDRFGTVWDRAGKGTLNRYTLDGRLIAQYRMPAQMGVTDQVVLAGDTLVFLLQRRLYTLP